jgi:uncharacterized membrane protein YphA (DoxX/SURF4 family)
LQRLYSMFPNGWPGRGLLLLRLASGTLLIYDGISRILGSPRLAPTPLQLIATIAGIFLLVGLWTPIAGIAVTITELSILLAGTNQPRSAILLAALGVSIAMLGPGSWSIDALLFGRQRLELYE